MISLLLLRQVPVDQGDRQRALADRRGDPLDRLGADVAGHEDARDRSTPAGTGRGPGPSRAGAGRRRSAPAR